jgi:hypothetical protein
MTARETSLLLARAHPTKQAKPTHSQKIALPLHMASLYTTIIVALKKREPDSPLAGLSNNPLTDPRRESGDRIYQSIMHGGGEPFGAPFESGVSSLTTKIVQVLKQAGFFGFETMERLRLRNRRNKFTRHGAAPYLGEYGSPGRKRK